MYCQPKGHTLVYQWVKKLQLQLFPATCLACGAPGEGFLDLCPGCRLELPWNKHACQRCGLPLHGNNALVCGLCQQKPPPFDRALTPFIYQPPLDYLIKALKFHGQLAAATLLGKLLYGALLERTEPLPEGILPVPLHGQRLAERGFNQALEIARVVSEHTGIPVFVNYLQRCRPTPPQVTLDVKARASNVREAFRVQHSRPISHVAILDDVITTASTVAELARVLREDGVAKIEVWACARTVGNATLS